MELFTPDEILLLVRAVKETKPRETFNWREIGALEGLSDERSDKAMAGLEAKEAAEGFLNFQGVVRDDAREWAEIFKTYSRGSAQPAPEPEFQFTSEEAQLLETAALAVMPGGWFNGLDMANRLGIDTGPVMLALTSLARKGLVELNATGGKLTSLGLEVVKKSRGIASPEVPTVFRDRDGIYTKDEITLLAYAAEVMEAGSVFNWIELLPDFELEKGDKAFSGLVEKKAIMRVGRTEGYLTEDARRWALNYTVKEDDPATSEPSASDNRNNWYSPDEVRLLTNGAKVTRPGTTFDWFRMGEQCGMDEAHTKAALDALVKKGALIPRDEHLAEVSETARKWALEHLGGAAGAPPAVGRGGGRYTNRPFLSSAQREEMRLEELARMETQAADLLHAAWKLHLSHQYKPQSRSEANKLANLPDDDARPYWLDFNEQGFIRILAEGQYMMSEKGRSEAKRIDHEKRLERTDFEKLKNIPNPTRAPASAKSRLKGKYPDGSHRPPAPKATLPASPQPKTPEEIRAEYGLNKREIEAAERSAPGPLGNRSNCMRWDAFLSHAWEDKAAIADPLYDALTKANVSVWYDNAEITVGDSLRQKMDEGLAHARYGIVILSPTFFSKHWPQQELSALFHREVDGEKVILPVWYALSAADIAKYSPLLRDRAAVKWEGNITKVVEALKRGMRSNPARISAGTGIAGTTSDPNHRTSNAAQSSLDLVCLVDASGTIGLFRLVSATRGDRVVLEISPENDRETAQLGQIIGNRGADIGVAFRSTALWARVSRFAQNIKNGSESWEVEIEDHTPRLHVMSEMSTTGLTADQIAERRARRILLGERDKSTAQVGSTDWLNTSMLESMIRGMSGPLKAVPVFTMLNADSRRLDPEGYCAAARLLAVLLLKLSQTVQDIWELQVQPQGDDDVTVHFVGQRGRKFVNADPLVITVDGKVNVREVKERFTIED